MTITNATYLHDYLIEVVFKDGTVRVVDLENFFKSSHLKLVRKFYPLELFKQFRIEDGVLCWGDNECDINPWNIYEGKYDVKKGYSYSTEARQSIAAESETYKYKNKNHTHN